MLFGPQFDDDAGDRIEPSPLRKKKTRNGAARGAAQKPANGASASAVPARLAVTRRNPATPSRQQSANGEDSYYSNSAGSNSSSTSLNNYYTANANTTTPPIKPRRRDPATTPPRPGKHDAAAGGKADMQCLYPSVWKALQFRKKTIPLASSTSVKPICVTGVDGFLASWIVAELLSRGYRVRGTVQSRTDDISGLLVLPNAKSNFSVVETSLLTPEACDVAVLGCDFVIHTGTPSSCSVRDPLAELLEPGVHSIGSRMHCIIPMMTNFIQACARAHVKRVVLTSSIAAMADSVSPSDIINENCWNITSSLERNPHFLSLKLAEEAAWQLVDQLPRDYRIDLVTINPGTLFGPSLSKSKLAPGNQIIFDLITGQYSALVDLNWSLVDVRDCAVAHVSALENLEARGRYICVNRTIWMKDIVDYLANNGYSGRDLPWRVGLPNWVARLPAYAAQLGQVGAALSAYDPNSIRPSPYLNEKVMDHFNLRFREVGATVIESANDLLKWGYIKPWAEDHEALDCDICQDAFTFYHRKHHCRECGVIICAECSKSRAVVEGSEDKVRLCDRCVKNSIPGLLDLLSEDDETSQKKASMAIEALMENELNHDYVTRYDGISRLLRVLHSFDEATASHAAGALVALSVNVSSALQMVLEGAVLQMLEVDETTRTWGICLLALRNIWKQINRNDFRKMLHAVARVSTRTNKGDLQGNILLTFVHMMDPFEVPRLLSEGLLSVLFQMLQSEEVFPRCAAAHAVKHLVPPTYAPDVAIDVPPYLVDDHEELLANSSLSDLQFLVKGHIAPINAHKVVLFFRNSYFKNMFGTATSQKGMIEIDNCSYEVFSLLLRFLYTGKVHITPDIAQELLRAASFYHVFELQKRAEEFLAGEIRVDNVVDLLTLAEECRAVDLKRNCVPFLMRNIHEVVGLPSFSDHRIRASEEVLKALASMLGPEWEDSFTKMMQTAADADGKKERRQKQQEAANRMMRSLTASSQIESGAFTPTSFLSPLAAYSMGGRSSGFTMTTTATDSPQRYSQTTTYSQVTTSDVAMPLPAAAYVKPFGNAEMLFHRGRQLSEDLSEVLSEVLHSEFGMREPSCPSIGNSVLFLEKEHTLLQPVKRTAPKKANQVPSKRTPSPRTSMGDRRGSRESHREHREQRGGVLVHVGNATNGVLYGVRLASSDLIVDELREELFKSSDIPLNDQILLGGPPFARLDPRRALSSYGLPSDSKRVFLYDRRMLMQENPLPPRLALEPVDFEMPTAPVSSSESSRMLSESSSPMIRALAEYESLFQLQLTQSEALERSSVANAKACERCVAELHVQAEAIAAAIGNLEIFRGNMSSHFTPFWTEFETAAAYHEKLLNNFESDLNALKTVTLHAALVTDERKTLYDCIPVDREREWVVKCEHSHSVMRAQVAHLKQVHDTINEEVGDLVRSQGQVSLAYADTTQELEQVKRFVASHTEITAKLANNVQFVTNRIAGSAPSEVTSLFASSAMLEICRDIEVLAHEQHGLIPSAEKIAEEIKATMSKLSSVKLSFFSQVHANLRRISVSQSKIRDFENSLAMLSEAMAQQKRDFNELDHLGKLPESYAACLKEVARRVRYGRRFSDRIQSMAEELAQLRDEEVHFREEFLRSFGQHLPKNLVPGLAEKPSHCEFRMRPFDQALPQIEEDSLTDEGADGSRSGAGSVTESKEDDEFFETRASDGMPGQHGGGFGGSDAGVNSLEAELLQKRCEDLEAKVAELTLELQQTKKGSSYFSDGSMAQSDLSKTSAREGDSSYDEFPLVLALAATAGAMTSSSEADRSNLLERELQSLKTVKAETETQRREKDALIAKLERENQQYLLNAAAFEEEIQERTRRETQLEENQAKLQQSVQALQLSVDMQRSALVKVLKLLDLLPPRERDIGDPGQFVTSHLDRVEARIRELTASADTEQVLRRELARQNDEIDMLASQHLDVGDTFKISFRSFNVNDLALFLPTSVPGSDAQRVYLAFHHGCPHRFLSEESISSFMIGGRKYPDYVVGRIVFIDEQTASDDHNPYGLHMGTTFYVLTVASLQDT